MRVKFLVVLAVICLCAHYASASGMGKDEVAKTAAKPNKPEIADCEKEPYTDQKKKTRVVTRKVIKKKENFKTCEETTKEEKAECEQATTPGYKAVFKFKDIGKECEWECNYDALPAPPPKKEKKLIKIKKPKEKKAKKECSGEKVIKFQNCLVKIRGLIAFGDKTKNFDKKFAKLVQKKAKKGAKKAKGGKKGGEKTPKTAAAPKK